MNCEMSFQFIYAINALLRTKWTVHKHKKKKTILKAHTAVAVHSGEMDKE